MNRNNYCVTPLLSQAVLEKTLQQLGIGGKRGVKQYWEELMKHHTRLVEDAEEQVEEFKIAMVSQREREREKTIVSWVLYFFFQGSPVIDKEKLIKR